MCVCMCCKCACACVYICVVSVRVRECVSVSVRVWVCECASHIPDMWHQWLQHRYGFRRYVVTSDDLLQRMQQEILALLV